LGERDQLFGAVGTHIDHHQQADLVLLQADIAITMDTYRHVLPGLDEQAAGTVAQLILGTPRRQKPSDDKALTRGRQAARRRREVMGEPSGQRWGDRGDSNPRPSGPQPDALTT
jgi:hypothetical protein